VAERYPPEDVVVLLGTPTPDSSRLYALTVKAGDPSWAGPLAGVALGLAVYHVTEEPVRSLIAPADWEEHVALMAMALDTEALGRAVRQPAAGISGGTPGRGLEERGGQQVPPGEARGHGDHVVTRGERQRLAQHPVGGALTSRQVLAPGERRWLLAIRRLGQHDGAAPHMGLHQSTRRQLLIGRHHRGARHAQFGRQRSLRRQLAPRRQIAAADALREAGGDLLVEREGAGAVEREHGRHQLDCSMAY